MNFARILNRRARFHTIPVQRSIPLRGAMVLCIAGLLVLAAGCSSTGTNGTPDAQKHHKKGVEQLEAQKYDDAILEFELALKIDPLYTLCKANLGLACHRRGFSDRGIKEIEDAIKTDPNVADSYNNLGEIYFDKKLYDRAEAQYKLAVETFPDYDEVYFNLGRLYEARREKDKALDAYQTAARVNPKNVNAHICAGRLYLLNGVDNEAEKHFLLALDYAPKSPFALSGLGTIAVKREQWEEAIKRYNAALELAPGDPLILQGLEDLYKKAPPRVAKTMIASAKEKQAKGNLLGALADLQAAAKIDAKLTEIDVIKAQLFLDAKPPMLDEAEAAVKHGMSIEPRDKDVRFMGAVVSMAGGKWKLAEDFLRSLRREDPKSAKFHKYLGVVYFKQRQLRKAEREWLETLKFDPDDKQAQDNLKRLLETPGIKKANALNDGGVATLRKGQLEEAEDLFKQAIEIDDQFAVAFSNLALTAIEKNDLKYARTKADEALQRDRDLGRAHNNLGVINSREGRLEDAKKSFTEAAALDPRDPEPSYNLGLLYIAQKKDTEAESSFEMALGIDPNHFRSHHELGNLYLRKGLEDKAERRYKLAIGSGDHFIPARIALARLYLKQKKYEPAIKFIQEANELDDSDPEPWLGLAEARLAMGEKGEARNALLFAAERLSNRSQFQKAVEVCQRAVAIDSASPDAHGDLGTSLMRIGRFQESLTELKKADDLVSALPPGQQTLQHRFNMGLCYVQMNDRARAAACFKDVIRAMSKNYKAMESLGELYQEGSADNPITKKEAVQLYTDAYKLEPDPDRKRIIKQRLSDLEK